MTNTKTYGEKTWARAERWENKAAKQTDPTERAYCLQEAFGVYASLGLYPEHLLPDAR